MVLTSSQLTAGEWNTAAEFEPITYEKLIGLNNLLNIAWLSRGLELAAPVARLVTPEGPGTGFLIGSDLILTNHHVVEDAAAADLTIAEFNYQTNWAGQFEPVRRFKLDGSHLRTSQQLDYTIVRVHDSPGDLFGYIDLATRAEPTVNDYVSIIQHPLGGPKQICFTDNKVAAVFGDLLQYSTDTEPGSSGAPVFNQRWQIVGLHHKGGGLAGPDGTKYFINESILITSVLRDAAAFLGLPDTLYDLAFADLRAVLVHLVEETVPPTDPRPLADELLRTRPRFSFAVDEWAKLNARPDENAATAVAGAGVAIGAAVRQWARDAGHESIKTAAMSDPAPSAKLYEIVSAFKGSSGVPSEVYGNVLAELRDKPKLVDGIVKRVGEGEGIAGPARAFLTGVSVGARAYDGAPRKRAKRRARSAARSSP